MGDQVDDLIASALRQELDSAHAIIKPDYSSVLASTRSSGSSSRLRRIVVAGLVSAVVIGLAWAGIAQRSGPTATAAVRHVGGWVVYVSDASAATDPTTAPRDSIEDAATATYVSLRHRYEAQGIYLGGDPSVEFLANASSVTEVTFPSGTSFPVPGGPADVWYAEVGASSAPGDPSTEVNMVFDGQGALLKALPAETPGMLHENSSLTVADLGTLSWHDVPTKTVELQVDCSQSPCDSVPHFSDAHLAVAIADYDGGLAVELHGSDMKPDMPVYLESDAGILGSAKTDPTGTFVSVITLSHDDVDSARAGQTGGLVKLYGVRSWEAFYACPFQGSVAVGDSGVSCTSP